MRDLPLRISYGPADDRLHDFYIPCLSASVLYERSAGFFSASALAVAAQGVAHLIRAGGRMRLLVGAELRPEDVEAIAEGAQLAEIIAPSMEGTLEQVADAISRERLAALAWMVKEGTLEIRVVLPRGPDGLPLPAEESEDYFHAKEGLFTDAEGEQVAFSGSVNESETGWRRNYEQFSVYTSWGVGRPWLVQVRARIARLSEGSESDWISIPIPDAVEQRLLRLAPERPPERDPLEHTERVPSDQRHRIIFQFLRDVPRLLHGGMTAAETSTIEPWPHQRKVATEVAEKYPQRFLLADEVGLGKTIEAGLALRELLLTGRVRRCLILVPKSVQRQWQEELYEKFGLNIPAYLGNGFEDYFRRRLPEGARPWSAFPVFLASSQLAKRKERQDELLTAGSFDLVIVDEAHHARRRDYREPRFRPNRLLELLLKLRKETDALYLLTATPMQVHPVEVWDLLSLLGLAGPWGASEEAFLRYFAELRLPFEQVDWPFVLRLLKEELSVRGGPDPAFARTAEERLGLVEWARIRDLPFSSSPQATIRELSSAGQALLLEFARRHTPLARLMFRATRRLLRAYRERGLLRQNVPDRDPQPVWIPMRDDERRLYHRIDEYISDFYQKYEGERKGLGFVMTVYRRRLTSSFAALERSLERRLEFLEGRVGAPRFGWTDEDWEEAQLERDVDELLAVVSPELYKAELRYIRDFLSEIRSLGGDSKWEHFRQEMTRFLSLRDSVVIFTQYTDTMDDLRDKLAAVYGSEVACYSGRGGEVWRNGQWRKVTKEEVKNAFRDRQVRILLCTEAASEGLNLQTCGVLINYDMPWNPMRVEQRIGRIDRIGQIHDIVWVRNYFYEDTVEALVYDRLSDRIDWFQTVVGELQPILAAVGRTIEHAAMARPSERQAILDREIEELREQIERAKTEGLALDDFAAAGVEVELQSPAIHLQDLEREILSHPLLASRFAPHPDLPGAYRLLTDGNGVAVTFSANVFDAHPETVRFLTYGEEFLEVLLAEVPPPEAQPSGSLARVASAEGVLWLHADKNGIEEPRGLDGLKRSLSAPGQTLTSAEAERWAMEVFREGRERALEARKAQLQADLSAREERGRMLLVRATAIEMLRSQQPELFDGELPPVTLWEDALERIAGRYPLSALLGLVGMNNEHARALEAEIQRLASVPTSRRRGLLADIRTEAARLVTETAGQRSVLTSMDHPPESDVEVQCFLP